MNCDCIKKVNERLKEKNLKLTGYSLMMPSFKARFYINTQWVERDKAPRGQKTRPTPMLVSFCPFCGTKVADEPEADK